MVGTALGVAGSGFLGCLAKTDQTQDSTSNLIIATIEGHDITLSQIEQQSQQMRAQYGGFSNPSIDFDILTTAIRTSIASIVVSGIAAQRGLVITDEKAIALTSDEIDKSIATFRQQAQTANQLKAGASEQEFQDFFKKLQGKTTAEIKAQGLDKFKSDLADPAKRETLLAGYYQQMLTEDFYTKTIVTEEEVKQSYDAFMVKSIRFDKTGTPEQKKAEADKALAEIKGGADFDVVIKKYMTTPAKDASRQTRDSIINDKSLAPIANLKSGQISEVSVVFGTPIIFKLVEIKSELPKDFVASKALYTDTFRRKKATNDLRNTITKAAESAKIVWKSPGYELVHKLTLISTDPDKTDEETKIALQSIVAAQVDLIKDPAGQLPTVLAKFIAAEQLSSLMTPQERVAFLQTHAMIILDVLNTTESMELRFRLVDLYDKANDLPGLASALKTAATNNTGFEPSNDSYFMQINKTLTELEKAKRIDATSAQEIRDILVAWSQNKADADVEKKEQTTSLDDFTIDPKTGKTLKQLTEEAAKKALDEANKPEDAPKKGG